MSSYSDLVQLDRPIAYWPLTDAGPTYADLGPSGITLQAVGTVTPHAYAGPLAGEHSAGFGGSPSQFSPFSYTGYLVGNGSPDPGFHDSSGNVVSASIPYVNLRGPLSLEAWLYPLGDPAWNPVQNSSDGWFGWGDPDGGFGGGFGSGISATMGFSNDPWYPGGYINAPFLYSYQYNTWSSPNGRRVSSVFTALDYRTTWMHLVLTVDRTGQGAIYINGVQQTLTGNQPWVFTFPPGNSLSTYPYQETAWFTIGSLSLPGTTWPSSGGVVPPSTGDVRQWNGGLAHVAMYNYALSACQVHSHTQAATTFAPVPSSYAGQVLADRPVAYWTCGGAPASLPDVSGHGHAAVLVQPGGSNAHITGGYSSPSGTGALHIGSSATVNGDYYAVTSPGTLPVANTPYSLEAWVKMDGHNDNGYIFNAHGSGVYDECYYLYQGYPFSGFPDSPAIEFSDGGWSGGGGTGLSYGQWYHVVGVFSGTAARFYLNGAPTSGPITPGAGIGAITAVAATIGTTTAFAVPGGDTFWGYLADVALYDYALSACQVQNHYLIALGVPVGPQPTPTITLPNPSFESGGTGWTFYGSTNSPFPGSAGVIANGDALLSASGPSPDGTHCAQITTNGGMSCTFTCPASGLWRWGLWAAYGGNTDGSVVGWTNVGLWIDGVSISGGPHLPGTSWVHQFPGSGTQFHLDAGVHTFMILGHNQDLPGYFGSGQVSLPSGWMSEQGWFGDPTARFEYSLLVDNIVMQWFSTDTGAALPPVVTGCKTYNDLILCDSPEVYWPLDGSGSTPYGDLGPNHNTLHEQQLSVNTPPPPALTHNSTGPIGGQGSVTFNGTTWLENSALAGVFYDVDTTGVYQTSGGNNVFTSMTFECWFKLPTPTSWNNFPCIELFQNSFTNSTFEFFPSTGPGYAANQGQLVLGNALSLVASQTTTITPLAWHHFVITYDWSNSLHFIPGPFQWQYPDHYTTGTACYLDGVLIPQPTGPGGWFTDRWNNPETWPGDAFFDWWSRADVVRLGAFYGDGYGYAYPSYNPHPDRANGMSLAGIALYSYALSSCQVLAHYQKATTGSYTPCGPCCLTAAQRGRRPFRQIHTLG